MTRRNNHGLYYDALSPAFGTLVDSLRGKRVAVVGHARPDGDCIGSQVALARLLRAAGTEAVCVNRDPVPRRLEFLCRDEVFAAPGDWKGDGYLAVAVDCADPDRPGVEVRDLFHGFEVNIDHHISNTAYAAHNFVDRAAAATAEVLAAMSFDNDWEIDPVAAQGLYVGMATDTGQFRFPSTSPRVFEIAARLQRLGADPALASNHLYERESMAKMKLLETFLSSLRLECDGRACIGVLPRGTFEKTGAGAEDTEGLVDYARCIEGVDIAAIMEDRGDETKGSLRAGDARFRVNDLASAFEGGGHACAAGFTAGKGFEQFYPEFLKALQSHFREVDSGGGTD